MKQLSLFLFIALFAILLFSGKPAPPRVLVYSKTNGWYHTSIPAGIRALEKLGAEKGFAVEATTDSLAFTTKNLRKYKAVIFLNTTGDVLGEREQKAFEKYIRSGRGFVGIHSACDTEYKWPWYNKLVGAYFLNHPEQQTARLVITNKDFPATRGLPAEWRKWDEWYNFKDANWGKMNILMTVDEASYKGGKNGDFHPVAWYHDYDGGRSFYTALGHTDESYTDPLFLDHLAGGISYAMGK